MPHTFSTACGGEDRSLTILEYPSGDGPNADARESEKKQQHKASAVLGPQTFDPVSAIPVLLDIGINFKREPMFAA
jgi:hypothetical protein